MTPDRWQQIEALFAQVADLPPAARAAALDAIPDADLRAEVAALLAADAPASAFFGHLADHLAPTETAPDALVGSRLGPYVLEALLGQGGMGTVYRAARADGQFAQTVALKLVNDVRPAVVARFRAERQILAGLEHPAIARLLDGGTTPEGRPYLVMEYVDGQPITAYADARRLPIPDRLALFATVCDAVQYAHGRLVVHRDLKPSNILVTADGQVKLLDFGIAKLLGPDPALEAPATQTDLRLLTPEYAAPEQVRGDAITTATDVYALGVLLYELLTGHRPYRLPSRIAHEVARVILEEEPTRPSAVVTQPVVATPGPPTAPEAIGAARRTRTERLRKLLAGDLDRIVLMALRKEPERRYTGAAALAADLRRHLAGHPVSAQPDSLAYRARTFVRRHRLSLSVGTLVALLLVSATVVSLGQAREARRAQERAEEVVGFLFDLFQSADPGAATNTTSRADFPVRAFLDQSVVKVRAELRDRPDVQVPLLLAIAGVYSELGLTDQALAALADLQQAQAVVYGPASLEVARTLNEQANVLCTAPPYDRARTLYDDALRLATAFGAAGDADRADILHDRAFCFGQDPDAEAGYQAAIDLYRRLGDSERFDLGTALENYALLLNAREQYAAAWQTIQEAYAIKRDLAGTRTTRLISVLGNMALIAEYAVGIEEAERLEREALAYQEAAYGPAHPTTITLKGNLSNTLSAQQRYGEAEALRRSTLAANRMAFGDTSLAVAHDLQNLGAMLASQPTRAAEAEALLREAQRLYAHLLPADHMHQGFPLLTLSDLYLRQRRYREAEAATRTALAIERAVLGPSHSITLVAQLRLGRSLIGLGQTAEGTRLLQDAHDQLLAAFGPDHANTHEAAEALAALRRPR